MCTEDCRAELETALPVSVRNWNRRTNMSDTIKILGEAELEIMQVIWNSEASVTSNYIL